MVSWAWAPVGGDWTYIANMERLYIENGYNVIPFSTKGEDNVPNQYEDYFVKAYNYKDLNKKKGIVSGIKALKNAVISFEAMNNLEKLLDKYEISFAHLHIIHHWVTPSIIRVLKKRKIPIIWTLHEYKLICPEGTFVSNGKVCEDCLNGKFYNCTIKACKKGSYLASSLASVDAYFYKFSGLYNKVDYYLCPSEFLLRKFQQFGFQNEKLRLTNYCYDIDHLDTNADRIRKAASDKEYGKFILYVGRIEKLKGIQTLIDAIDGTGVKLKIAGTGSYLEEAKNYVEEKKIPNIEFLGFQNKDRVYELTIKSEFVVCPSEWYENYPFSVIESLLLGKPVVGSDMGGIPELVINGKTGYIHKAGNHLELRDRILRLWNDKEQVVTMGKEAREYAFSKVNFKTHWTIMQDVINNLNIRS